jgi:hypothetical protein
VAGCAADFLDLLGSRNNRLVWGAMIGLSTIAGLKAAEIAPHVDKIIQATKTGSVITADNGVKALALVAARAPAARKKVVSFLLDHLQTCRPKDVPQHSESALPAVSRAVGPRFVKVLSARLGELNPSQLKRVKKVIAACSGPGK